ncbi:helix-turn-helix domain-containing protein [Sneathiella sp. P13V-1]|uniref:IclR family transcriptional regulator n=1 Tax=Sneathiella sp. P13V-1 TaxID=2697366 RepID=UPI00187B99FD|nr:IclR family transcriptional regulator C-terminal domain-containing protein [Sneathiella sp. P13V-1]MBE7635454.1 helix-turn-helix domain-containing protein [Sneathiella sp. P13V-1]
MASTDKQPANRSGQVQSLTRALSLMNAISQTPNGIKLTDLARKVGLAASTAHRLLTTLQEQRYVQYDRDTNFWQIGIQAFVTGNGFLSSRDLVSVARPIMRRMMEESGETINLAISEGDDVIYMAQVESREMMRVYSKPGNRVPLHCSGVGKAIMSVMSDKDINRIIHEKGLPRLTDRTLTDPDALIKELKNSRENAYAIDDEEHAIGLRCAASVIYDEYSEPMAAISISGPAARISNEKLAKLGQTVRTYAAEITSALGGVIPASIDAG